MKTQIIQQNANIAAVQPSAVLSRKGTEGRRTATTGKRPDTISALGLLAQALGILLLAAAIAPPATAQNIYVDNTPSIPSVVSEYSPIGTIINASLVNAPEADFRGLSVSGSGSTSGSTLVLADQEEFPYNDAVEEVNAITGARLGLTIPLPRSTPWSALIGGPHMFVLHGYTSTVTEYLASNGTEVNSDVSAGTVPSGEFMAGWTDSSGNVNLYVSNSISNTGSIVHITVPSIGNPTNSTLVSGLNYPQGIAVSPDGQYVYVITQSTTINGTGYISSYATSNGAWQWTSASISGGPFDIAASGAAPALFVTRQLANAVSAYYASTGAPLSDPLITGVNNPLGIAVGPGACVTPPGNMVAWYPFDQSGSSQQDLTSYNNSATAYGNYTSITGEVANALHFDGTSAYVQAADQPQLDMGTGDFSIDAWVKISSSADDQGVVVLVDKRQSSPIQGYHFFLYNGLLGLQLASNNNYYNYVSTTAVPANDAWHLVTVTVHRATNGGVWYLDGRSVGTFSPTVPSGSLNSAGTPLMIGVREAGLGGWAFFKGGLDELEIFNRVLSPAEVLSLYLAGSNGKCK